MKYESELEAALAAVTRASRICSRVQADLSQAGTQEKSDGSPVTLADLASQAVINLGLKKSFQDDAVVAEESADALRSDEGLRDRVLKLVNEEHTDVAARDVLDAIDRGNADGGAGVRFWTIDPIDGTKGFLRGDQYAVALALIENGERVLGVLGCPNFRPEQDALNGRQGWLFYAVKGEGAFAVAPDGGTPVQIGVGQGEDISQARFVESVEKAHAAHGVHQQIADQLGIKAEAYRVDSQVKYAAVACGDASIYLRLPRDEIYREKIWDHAAGAIVVEEAGGRVTDRDGNDLNFSRGRRLEDNLGVVATNGAWHDAIIDAIRSASNA
jgi:3'(2'), 5'-bisphosphate nucleotidase